MTSPTAGGITVHRCVVRVVRQGGWSWGPDPRNLVQQVLDALPDLLAERFDEQLAGDGPDVEIREPVQVSVLLGRSASSGRFSVADMVVEPAFDTPVVEEVVESLPGAGFTESVVDGWPDSAWLAPTPAMLFGELAERGELAPLLALLPDESLRVYVIALLEDAVSEPPSAVVLDGLAAELARRVATSGTVEVADLVRLVQNLPEASVVPDDVSPVAGVPRVEVADVPAEAVGETRISSVLPFLLAGPLARTGYLDAIGPALAGIDLLPQAPLFAAALAYKVLGDPARGWRRSSEDSAAAAAFAGLESVPDLGDFADRVRPALPVLDGVLALSLCRGHDPADALLVGGADGGVLLVDAHGMFPIAWAPEVAGLLPHWEACGRPPVLVCDSPLPPSTLRDLVAAGVQLITEVRPLRDDPLSRVPWRTPLWTSGAPDMRLAAKLPGHATRLDELTRMLFGTRRAVPRVGDGALDRGVGLAASLGLGMIAWMLWRDKETPDPVLALTRFADLEATVLYTPDAVRVKIPLGRRHADLWRGGALADVPDVVWLGGRPLTFSGG